MPIEETERLAAPFSSLPAPLLHNTRGEEQRGTATPRTDIEAPVFAFPHNRHGKNENVPRTRRMRHPPARPHIGILQSIIPVLYIVERTEKLQADELCARTAWRLSDRKGWPAYGTEAAAIE